MKLQSLRLGFANNSSSSHSIVFLSKIGYTPAKTYDNYNNGEFGWDNFTLVSKDAKTQYLALQLYLALMDDVTPELARAAVDNIFGCAIREDDYIDHQSEFMFPVDYYNQNKIAFPFYKAYVDYIVSNPDIVILGGNDNSDAHPYVSHLTEEELNAAYVEPNFYQFWHNNTVRWDDAGYWVVYQLNTGNKVRISFDTNEKITKSHLPELVDLKITNACPFECSYCYQDSVPDGQHADPTVLHYMVPILKSMGVFEVAIGGGEPTMYDEFYTLIKLLRKEGIVPNFTTRSLAWLHDDKKADVIFDNCGSFAVSVTDAKQIKAIVNKKRTRDTTWGERSVSLSIQVVMGTVTRETFAEILAMYYDHRYSIANLTLLGYKTTGRGNTYDVIDYSWWLDDLQAFFAATGKLTIAIDTVMAAQFDSALQEAGISDVLYSTEEGKFSMYIDAVDMKCGPSSFCDESQMVKLENKYWLVKNTLLDAYHSF